MIYGFDTSDETAATAALLVYVVWRSRDKARFKITPDVWGQVERFVKDSAKRATRIPEFIEAVKSARRLNAPTLHPRHMEVGLSGEIPLAVVYDESGKLSHAVQFSRDRDTGLREFGTQVLERADHAADIRAVAMTRARLDDAVPDRWHRLHGDSDLVFVGLRRDESRARQITLNRLGVIHKPATGITRAAPLAGLRTIDVAAIVVSRGLPVLSLYERDGFGARSSTRVPRASHSIRETMLAELRESDPPAYASLCQLYPEIAGRAPEEIGEGAA